MSNAISVLLAARSGRGDLLASVLRADPDIEVAGVVESAREALPRILSVRPQVVAFDVDLECTEAITRIMAECPTPVVLFVSRRGDHDASRFVQGLSAGAVTVLRDMGRAVEVVKEASRVRVREALPPAPKRLGGDHVVAIGCSVGGPGALNALLSRLPEDFPAPILVAQHLAEGFIDSLAEWLDKVGPLRVKVAEDGDRLQAGQVYLGPHDRHLTVAGNNIALSDAAPVEGFRPAANVLFEGVARSFGAGAIGVILTGLGSDGVVGLRAIRECGGRVVAQDQDTATAFGMPGAAIGAGLCDAVLPISAIGQRLEEMLA